MDKLFEKIHATLPIFAIEHKHYHIIYTPGYYSLFENKNIEVLKNYFSDINTCKESETQKVICDIITRAQQNLVSWKEQKSSPFIPECLTIHVGNECNLNCEYCYSKINNEFSISGFPDIEDIKIAFKYIIKHKSADLEQITIVYHGSGEPTYHWKYLVETHNWIKKHAAKNNINIFSYIATNGYIKPEQAKWLAKNMCLIGISCDGPDSIQKKQRTKPTKSIFSIKETCQIIKKEQGRFNIRATITPDTVNKQKHIAEYLITTLGANTLRFEPIYLKNNGFTADHAEVFFENFVQAQNFALKNNATIEYSGVRIDEMHDTYCDIFKNNLRLTPDGIIRNCFCKFSHAKGLNIGNIQNSCLQLNTNNKNSTLPEACLSCINMLHCSRGCPDFCYSNSDNKLNAFKCKLHKLLTVNEIKTLAKSKIT